jgi:cation transport ATPase
LKSITLAFIIAVTACLSSFASAQMSPADAMRDLEDARRKAEYENAQFQSRMQQIQAQTDRTNAEIDRLRADTERMQRNREVEEANNRAREIADRAERAAQAQAEAAQQAKDEKLDEMEAASAHTRNGMYVLAIAISSLAFFAYIVKAKKLNPEGEMKYNEKFGVVTIIVSALVILFALIISEGWNYKLDFFQSVMFGLSISLFPEEGHKYPPTYLIDIPTKYVFWVFLCTAAYGLTTYLGITPAIWKPGPKAEAEGKESN